MPGKQRFSKPNNQLPFGKRSESRSNASQRHNAGKDRAVRDSIKATKPTSISNGDGAVVNCLVDSANAMKSTSPSDVDGAIVDHYLDKCVVSQNNEDMGSSHLVAKNAVDPSHKLVISQGSTGAHKDNVLPKIKWGDLDEGTLEHYGKVSGAEVKNQNLVSVKVGGAAECLPCTVLLDREETKSFEDKTLPESMFLSPRTICVEEVTKEVNEVSLEDVKEQITSEKIVSQITSISGSNVEHKHLDTDTETTSDPSGENVNDREMERIDSANSLRKPIFSDVSVVPLTDSASSSSTIDVHSDNLQSGNYEPESGEPTLAAPIEGSSNKKSKANSDGLLDAQNADVVNSDDLGESKERFRERLWCFLFENLNRAVDELYLLCELECDLEQMKEASLVLEEAALDFTELNSRVEKFEKLKRSSAHGDDGGPLVLQSDHRRPHALSWEVSFLAHQDTYCLVF